MKPLLETVIPARRCLLIAAELSTNEEKHQLRLRMQINATMFLETLIGNDLMDLLYQLTARPGFSPEDARRILCIARGGN